MSRYVNDNNGSPSQPFRRVESMPRPGQTLPTRRTNSFDRRAPPASMPMPSRTSSFQQHMTPQPPESPPLPMMWPQNADQRNMAPPYYQAPYYMPYIAMHYQPNLMQYPGTPAPPVDRGRSRAYMPQPRRRYSPDNYYAAQPRTTRSRSSSPTRSLKGILTSRSLSPSRTREPTRTPSPVPERVRTQTPPPPTRELEATERRRLRRAGRARVEFEESGVEDDVEEDDGDRDGNDRTQGYYRRPVFVTEDDRDRFDDSATSTVYSFTPSHTSRAASAQGSSSLSDEDPPEKEETETNISGGDAAGGGAGGGNDHAKPNTAGIPLQSYIFRSEYSGDHILGGSHGAKLTAVVSSRLKHMPLFRWRHCSRSLMNFDEFSAEATRGPDLTAAELKGIRNLLTRVQRKFVKSVQTAAGESVRHMEPSCIQQTLPPESSSKAAGGGYAPRTVTWVCLPYFALEKYSGLQQDVPGGNRSTFPAETLLQSKFSRATRERDMRQAVCQAKNMPAGLCFHVAQIWCLVVDNSFLFTYGRMTEETLRGDAIDMTVKPVQDIPIAHQSFITVSHKSSVLWSIPIEECHTWLDFLSHFREFWPQRLLFYRRTRQVTADYWPQLWNMAKHVGGRIMLEMRVGAPATPPPVGVLPPKEEDATEPSPGPAVASDPAGSKAASNMKMSIFSCLRGVLNLEYGAVDEDVLDDHLREVDEFLRSETRAGDQNAYKDCPEASRDEVYTYLDQEGTEVAALDASSRRARQRVYETHIDIFNAASVVFAFFFPPGVEVPTIRKFWGALKVIIIGTRQPARRNFLDDSASKIRSELRGLCVTVQAFSDIFARCSPPEMARIVAPDEMTNGWVHLLMGLIYLPTDFDRSDRFVEDAKRLMYGGMADVVRSLSDRPLLDRSVVLPLELLSLLGLKLVQDTTVGMPDISECYSASLDEMESDIASKASDRSREYRISLIAEEISAVQRVVDAQLDVFGTLWSAAGDPNRGDRGDDTAARGRNYAPGQPRTYQRVPEPRWQQTPSYPTPSYNGRSGGPSAVSPTYASAYGLPTGRVPSPTLPTISASYARTPQGHVTTPVGYYDSPTMAAMDTSTDFRLSSTDAGGYRVLLLNECLQFLARRQIDFNEFRSWASSLEKVNQNKIDTTKDRHDNALYAFTIVTIVFLPLSFVASVFGMNTNDVRNMDLNQWAYWATAVPVTAVVIFLGLLWTGELGNIVGWIQSFGQRQLGYRTLYDDDLDSDDSASVTSPQSREARRWQ